jgi:exodeoxyribonuclease VII large subunit
MGWPVSSQDESVYTVSRFSRELRFLLESHFDRVAVRGEVTNLSRPQSGHVYFSLVDDESASGSSRSSSAQVQVVLWKSTVARQRVPIEPGMRVVVVGRVGVYEPRGSYQIIATQVLPVGVGDLQIAFDRLKARLFAEGLFDPTRKRALPFLPRCIGLVTSPSGAAIRDFLRILYQRFPAAWVRVVPVRVQGEGAAEEIAAAIDLIAGNPGPIEVLVLARGGGSLEDLWAFNEEVLARAIHRSRIPVVSAVGHEVDVTIADFVADCRAPTPTAAAELVIPDLVELDRRLGGLTRRLLGALERHLDRASNAVDRLARGSALRDPQLIVQQRVESLDRAAIRLENSLYNLWREWNDAVRVQAVRLESLSPLSVLSRGYAVVFGPSGRVVRGAGELSVGDRVRLRWTDGSTFAVITENGDG